MATGRKLSGIYYNPANPGALGSKARLKKAAKNISSKEVDAWLLTQPAYTLHRPRKLKFPRNKTYVTSKDELFQADLLEFPKLIKQNKGYRYVLCVIDILSRFAWGFPLKTKTAKEIIPAFREIFETRVPLRLYTDKGLEFSNKEFIAFLKKYGVRHYGLQSELKAQIAEKFIKGLKSKIYRLISKTNDFNYVKNLKKLFKGYNNTVHSTTKMKPVEVNIDNEHLVWKRLYSKKNKKIKQIKPKFKVGDLVRLATNKGVFEKGYIGYFTVELFRIHRILHRPIPVYIVIDKENNIIGGSFYAEQLLKVSEEGQPRRGKGRKWIRNK